MPVGLEVTNNNNQVVMDENTISLRFSRKSVGTVPTLAENEFLAIKRDSLDSPVTYYVFTTSHLEGSAGLDVYDTAGNVRMRLAEGYAQIVGVRTLGALPAPYQYAYYEGYPVSSYALMTAAAARSVAYGDYVIGPHHFDNEVLLTTSTGFRAYMRQGPIINPQAAPQFIRSWAEPSTVAIVDVSRL